MKKSRANSFFTGKKKIILILDAIILCIIGAFFLYTYGIKQPSNTKEWEWGAETLPKITQNGNKITIKHMRDDRYTPGKRIIHAYTERTVTIQDIERAWFVVEPFELPNYPVVKGIAHTYFVFDIKDSEPVVVSVEARRERNEDYDAFTGLFNNYELMYVWGSEKDETLRRILLEDNSLYMYPLLVSPSFAQKLFVQLAHTTQELYNSPRFYNSLTSNCTNELAKNANAIKKGSIPFNLGLFLPDYAAEELYKLQYIPHDEPFETVKSRYYISDISKKIYNSPDYSQKLRKYLLTQS